VIAEKTHQDARQSIKVVREFDRDQNGALIAVHTQFRLPKSQQGAGIAKKVLNTSMLEYQRLGVQRVELNANLEMGGYAWAKFGFQVKRPARMVSELKAVMGQSEEYHNPQSPTFLTFEQKKAIIEVMDQHVSDPKLAWRVAGLTVGDRKIGRELLNQISWEGTLQLDNAEQMARFWSYVRSTRGA
jgi:hypothetical protein